jgi:hypothetical protein
LVDGSRHRRCQVAEGSSQGEDPASEWGDNGTTTQYRDVAKSLLVGVEARTETGDELAGVVVGIVWRGNSLELVRHTGDLDHGVDPTMGLVASHDVGCREHEGEGTHTDSTELQEGGVEGGGTSLHPYPFLIREHIVVDGPLGSPSVDTDSSLPLLDDELSGIVGDRPHQLRGQFRYGVEVLDERVESLDLDVQ